MGVGLPAAISRPGQVLDATHCCPQPCTATSLCESEGQGLPAREHAAPTVLICGKPVSSAPSFPLPSPSVFLFSPQPHQREAKCHASIPEPLHRGPLSIGCPPREKIACGRGPAPLGPLLLIAASPQHCHCLWRCDWKLLKSKNVSLPFFPGFRVAA